MADFTLDIDWFTSATSRWLNVVPGYARANDSFAAAVTNVASKSLNLKVDSSSWSAQRWNAGTTYFKMQGMDQQTDGLYATWIVTGLPDYSASQYSGVLNLPLRDVHIVDSWETL